MVLIEIFYSFSISFTVFCYVMIELGSFGFLREVILNQEEIKCQSCSPQKIDTQSLNRGENQSKTINIETKSEELKSKSEELKAKSVVIEAKDISWKLVKMNNGIINSRNKLKCPNSQDSVERRKLKWALRPQAVVNRSQTCGKYLKILNRVIYPKKIFKNDYIE